MDGHRTNRTEGTSGAVASTALILAAAVAAWNLALAGLCHLVGRAFL